MLKEKQSKTQRFGNAEEDFECCHSWINFLAGGNLMMKYWAIFFSVFMIAIVALADTGHLGKLWLIYSFPGGHWGGHFVLFGLLSFVVDLSLFEERPSLNRKRIAIGAGLILAVFVGLEEFSQRFLPTRHSSPVDFAFSCLGIAFFSCLVGNPAQNEDRPQAIIDSAS
jgi:polysaccharide biosynthesis protein VpsQ